MMSTALFWAVIIICVPLAKGQVDCHIRADYNDYFYYGACWFYHHYYGSWGTTYFSCANDYKCCDNGCCPNSNEMTFSDMETVGVVLSTTAMFTTIVLALIICGFTFCDGREDEGKIFGKYRRGTRSYSCIDWVFSLKKSSK
ncbi:hypothetical protein ACJMK2_019159 [Sinanodonta woodiana]|uniref:Uncharacterized protein n=1 Tax=Sinanodonta woodiana TaxID=1069815 RepID=A0ABD3UH61_SINWO